MDRRLQADDQWYVSPLLDLFNCKEELLEARDAMEDSIFREIPVGETESEKEKETIIWTENMAMIDGVTDEEAAEAVEEVGNLGMFTDEPSISGFQNLKNDKQFLEESTLFTHKGIQKRDEFANSSRQRKSAYVTSLKYEKYLMDAAENTNLYRPQCSLDAKSADDIVIVVDVLTPYNRMLHSSEFRSSRLLKPINKFLLRGETLLYDLRKKLICPCDTVAELKNGAELDPIDYDESTAEKFPSSFIFIHDTFYVDSLANNATDISFPIRNFMQSRSIFDPVDAKKIEDVRIIDLKLRLGQPYVFQHSGTCEHLLVFHDLRLMHESDPRDLDKYPYTLYEKGNEKKCDACRKSHVEFVVDRHELLPQKYTYFCRSCFEEFNFVHGVKTHSFVAWPYTELQNRDIL